jgi:hypothetical protein
MVIATDNDPSDVLAIAQEAGAQLSRDCDGTMDEDAMEQLVSVEEYKPAEGETPPRAFGVNVPVSDKRVGDLLCGAFEGGSSWFLIKRYENPDNLPTDYKHIELPLSEHGAVICADCELGVPEWRLDRAAIDRGLKLMATKHPKHWGDFIGENDDADTADIFLQLCLLGELVYC